MSGSWTCELEIGACFFSTEITFIRSKDRKYKCECQNLFTNHKRFIKLTYESPQSFSLSHFHIFGMQRPLVQANCDAAHVTFPHSNSSEWSPLKKNYKSRKINKNNLNYEFCRKFFWFLMSLPVIFLIATETQWYTASRFTLEFIGSTSWF